MAYIEMKHSFKRYQIGETEIVANNDISFEIEKGELVIILGASGAGKSTVLNILGGMDTNDEGDILIDGQNIADYNSHQLTDYRRNDVGFVFQFYNLVPNLTAKENVELASEIVKDAQDPVAVLTAVGMENRLNNFPAQLSGGEQQRVAIARALLNMPKIILADEPTGALDSHTGEQIMLVLRDHIDAGAAGILVTHEARMAAWADRTVFLRDGRIVDRSRGDSLRDLLAGTAPRI